MMDQKLTFRKIGQDDLEFVYQSLCDLEQEILEVNSFREIFNENIHNPDYLYLLAEGQASKIGFINFHTQKLLHHCGLVGEIQEFYVIPSFRHTGVGRQLFQRILDFAKQLKLKSIEVTSNRARVENVDIYQSFGFALTHNKFTINQ